MTQETNDKKQLMPMITTIAQQSGATPAQLLADAAYCSDENLAAIADTTIDAYISTRKQTHGEQPGPCPRGPLPTTATRVEQMSHKLHTTAGAAVYAARKAIVEPVIGQIKQARGFRQFLLGGFDGARRMGVGVHDAQHSQAVSPLQLNGRPIRSSASIAHAISARPSPSAATDMAGAQDETT